MTAFLLARGASPHEDDTGIAAEAELLGHWLAAEIISAWARINGDRGDNGLDSVRQGPFISDRTIRLQQPAPAAPGGARPDYNSGANSA